MDSEWVVFGTLVLTYGLVCMVEVENEMPLYELELELGISASNVRAMAMG
jgi:hypothetical protein